MSVSWSAAKEGLISTGLEKITSREVPLSPERACLLIVDVQMYTTCRPGFGAFRGGADLPEYFPRVHNEVLPNIAKLQTICRLSGVEVIFTVIENLTRRGTDRGLDYKLSGLSVPKGSSLANVHPAVKPSGDEIIIPKSTCSVFNGVFDFAQLLRNFNFSQVAICGVMTNQCIESAVRDGADKGFLVTVVEDACAAPTMAEHRAALGNMKGFGRIVSTESLIQELITVRCWSASNTKEALTACRYMTHKALSLALETAGAPGASTISSSCNNSNSNTMPAFSNCNGKCSDSNGASKLNECDDEKAAASSTSSTSTATATVARSSSSSRCYDGCKKVIKLAMLRTCHDDLYGCYVPVMFTELMQLVATECNRRLSVRRQQSRGTAGGLSELEEISITIDDYNVEEALEYPAERAAYDGFIIPGSLSSAYDNDAWIKRLYEEIVCIHAEKRILLGVCFGHQAVAQALGGQVERRPSSGVNDFHFCRQPFTVMSSTTITAAKVEQHHGVPPSPSERYLFYHHCDMVTSLPAGAVTSCSSSAVSCHGMFLNDHILTFQAHPEFSCSAEGTRCLEKLLINDLRTGKINGHGFANLLGEIEKPTDLIWAVGLIADLLLPLYTDVIDR